MLTQLTSPADVYNEIANDYLDVRQSIRCHHFVNATMSDLIGDPTGLDAIDLATGEGACARLLKRNGARSVLGVDISCEMIGLACEAEAQDPLDVNYVVADVATFEAGRTFDLATAGFLLNYAASRDQLRSLCAAARRLLKPGARFVGVNSNMFVETYGYNDWASVGRRMSGPSAPQEGDVLTIRLATDSGREIVFDNYFLKPETYEAVFAETGFSSFRWVPLSVTPEARASLGDKLVDHLLEHSQIIGFEARV